MLRQFLMLSYQLIEMYKHPLPPRFAQILYRNKQIAFVKYACLLPGRQLDEEIDSTCADT